MSANYKYHFNLEKAKEISGNTELIKKEALVMIEAFKNQGNESHSLEGQTIYKNSVFMEKVFYEELVPVYKDLKNLSNE